MLEIEMKEDIYIERDRQTDREKETEKKWSKRKIKL